MKKKLLILLSFICLTLLPFKVEAASANISVSGTSTAMVGSTVTINVNLSSSTPMGSWQFLIDYDSSMLQLSSGNVRVADYTNVSGGEKSKSYTLKFKALKSGTAKVSVGSYVVYAYDESEMSVTGGSKSVKIMSQSELEATYSKNNNLSSIKVDEYELTPAFNKNTTEYKVTVPSNVEKVNVSAVCEDKKSKVSGTGEIEVAEGENKVELIVTAENGSTKKYNLVINVEDENPIQVEVNKKKYSVVKRASSLTKPDLFEETTIKIGDIEVPGFVNKTSKITLIGLKDEGGNISLFIYKNKKYLEFNEVKSDSLSIIFTDMKSVPKKYTKTKIKINDKDMVAYKLKGENKVLVYGINLSTGKENYYTYDKNEKTLQIFDKDKYENNLKESDTNKCLIYGLSGIVLILFILLSLVTSKNKKMKKLLILKEDKK